METSTADVSRCLCAPFAGHDAVTTVVRACHAACEGLAEAHKFTAMKWEEELLGEEVRAAVDETWKFVFSAGARLP